MIFGYNFEGNNSSTLKTEAGVSSETFVSAGVHGVTTQKTANLDSFSLSND
jgi:hypothetical protein